MKIRGAIFDMDGTITDSMYLWRTAASGYVKSVGKTPAPDLDARVSHKSVFDTIAVFRSEYGITGSDEEISMGVFSFVEEAYRKTVVLKDGVLELIRELWEKKIPICVATATDRHISGPALSRLGIEPYVKELFTVAEVGKGKDFPDIYHAACKTLGSSVEDTVVFEDAPYAVKTAKKAGFFVVGLYDEVYGDEWENTKKVADIGAVSMREVLGKFDNAR